MQAHFPIHTLVLALGGVIPAASDDTTRPLMSGVLVRVEGDKATFVATDGHMLAAYTTARVRDENAPCDSGDVFLPIVTAKALLKAAKSGARATAGDNFVTLDTDAHEARTSGVSFALPSYDGGFPPYEQVLPKYLDEPRAAKGGGASFVGLGMELLATVAGCFKGAGGGNATVIPGTGELDPVLFLGQRETTRDYGKKTSHPCPLTVVLMPCRIAAAGAPDPFAPARERAALLAAGCPKLAEVFAPN